MVEIKKFKKTKEDFYCDNCGYFVCGNGYTNHCPKCFWSKHVDVNPGDRMSDCGGSMRPISLKIKNGDYILKHKCVKCGHEKNNKISKEDDFDKLIELSKTFCKE
jgi:Zn finger protein HypA/HybF involved in hydrogenase expression